MTPQMDAEQPRSAYGRYEGSQGYAQQQSYETPYGAPQGGAYDDEFVDGLAQRLAQHMGQIPQGKVLPGQKKKEASSGERLGLAIVSVCVLIPISIVLMTSAGFGGLIGLAVVCAAIVLINAIFNGILPG